MGKKHNRSKHVGFNRNNSANTNSINAAKSSVDYKLSEGEDKLNPLTSSSLNEISVDDSQSSIEVSNEVVDLVETSERIDVLATSFQTEPDQSLDEHSPSIEMRKVDEQDVIEIANESDVTVSEHADDSQIEFTVDFEETDGESILDSEEPKQSETDHQKQIIPDELADDDGTWYDISEDVIPSEDLTSSVEGPTQVNHQKEVQATFVEGQHKDIEVSTDVSTKDSISKNLDPLSLEDDDDIQFDLSYEDDSETRYKNNDFTASNLDTRSKSAKQRKFIFIGLAVLVILGGIIYGLYSNGITPSSIIDSLTREKIESEKVVDNLTEPQLVDYMKVGDQVITVAEIEKYNQDYKYMLLDRMIEDTFIEQYAATQGITITTEELNGIINTLMASYSSKEDFERMLFNGRTTIEGFKRSIKLNTLKERVTEKLRGDVAVSDKELQDYYSNSLDYVQEMGVRYLILNKDSSAYDLKSRLSETLDVNILLKAFADNENVVEQPGITRFDTIFGKYFDEAEVGSIIIVDEQSTDNMVIGLVTYKHVEFVDLKSKITELLKDSKKYRLFEEELTKFKNTTQIEYFGGN